MTLRTRLSWIYGCAVVVAVLVVVIVSIAAIDRALRSSLDARLRTAASTVAALVDVQHERINIDAEDRSQFLRIFGSSMDATIVRGDGSVLLTSSTDPPPGLGRAIAERRALVTLGSGERETRVAIEPIVHEGRVYGAVAAWRGSDWIDEFDRDAIIAMGLAAMVAGALALTLSSLLVRRALAPVREMSALATDIEAHDLSRRLGTRGQDELSHLGAAFDRMLDRLEQAFVRQRRFTADASHELRAPLAVIRAEADLALQRDRTPSQYRAALEAIAHESERIDHLVDALLLAARADAGAVSMEPLDVAALLDLVVTRLTSHARARGVAIACELSECWVRGDAPSLERAFTAVLHNAIDFANASVTVTGDGQSITVTDDGPGFTPEALAHATERFWRGDAARPRGATGLGLAIADAIVRAHGGRLALSNGPSGGAIVRVRLVVAPA